MANVQPEFGTAPLAYALLEAFSKDPKMKLPAQIIFWVFRNTYGRRIHGKGPRRKTCFFTWTKIAEQIGAMDNRSRVSRTGRELIEAGRLYVDSKGHIGIQKDYEKWAEMPGSVSTPAGSQVTLGQISTVGGSEVTRKPGQNGTAIRERAHEVLSVESYPVMVGATPPILPNGKKDTASARAELGHADLSPVDHQDYTRLSWKVQEKLLARWEEQKEKNKPKPCRVCRVKPPHSANWPYCKDCTICIVCREGPGGKRTFSTIRQEIVCNICKEKN